MIARLLVHALTGFRYWRRPPRDVLLSCCMMMPPCLQGKEPKP